MANKGIKGLRRFADDGGTSTTSTGPGDYRPPTGETVGFLGTQSQYANLTQAERDAIAAKEREQYLAGVDQVMKIRAENGMLDPNYDYGPGYGKGGQEWLARNPNVNVKPFKQPSGTSYTNPIANTPINPNIGVNLPGITTTPTDSTQPTLGQWQNAWTGQWKTPADVASLFRQTPGANPNPSAADLNYYLQKGPEQLLKDVQAVRGANPTMANLLDQQRAQQGLRFQEVYKPQYQNYANPLTMTNVSNYGTRPAPSAAYQNYLSGNPMTPGGIPAMMQNIRNWADQYSQQGGAGIGQIASDMQKYGINAADLQAAYSGGYGQNAPSLFNPSLYASSPAMDAVRAQYAGIGRFGVGTGAGQIDPSGLQYWAGQLQSGALPASQFPGAFGGAVQNYMQQNPYSGLSQGINLFQNTYGPYTGAQPYFPQTPFSYPQPKVQPSPVFPPIPKDTKLYESSLTPQVLPPQQDFGYSTQIETGMAQPMPSRTARMYEPSPMPQYGQSFGGMGGGFGGFGGFGGSMGGFGGFGGMQPSPMGGFGGMGGGFGGGFGGMGGGFGGMGGGFGAPQPSPIVSRSAQVRGTPNVMMRRAGGGILSLLKKK